MELRVAAIRYEAEGVVSLELRDPGGGALPAFAPGAHIDLHLPNGVTRSYSLASDAACREAYVVGVGLDPKSRGGSRFVHERLRVGQMIAIDGPRNNFPLMPSDAPCILIAGGIGITPMMAMVRELASAGRDHRLYYAARDRTRAAFLDELARIGSPLTLHLDDEAGGPFDMAKAIAAHPGAHFYCCGPGPMLEAFERCTQDLPGEQVHLEYFAPKVLDAAAPATGFEVEARRSGKSAYVEPGQSISQALAAIGIAVPLSCAEGICGTCETRILEGEAEHRDSVLSKAEQAANRTLMVCVSRCRGARLVLDL